ncbi:hypothetical protein FACS1894217_13060 [Clostridia bacterium]|nr:hypothetical protein FACS1894217_13060 [Clostridia bacterium]
MGNVAIAVLSFLDPSPSEGATATSTPTSGGILSDVGGGYLQTILGVVVFVALIVGAIFALRWFSRKTYGPMTSKNIQMLERCVVGREASLMLVRVGTRTLLLSATKDNVSVLRELEEDDLSGVPAAPPTFAAAMKQAMPAPLRAAIPDRQPSIAPAPKPQPEPAPRETAEVSGQSRLSQYDNAINAMQRMGTQNDTYEPSAKPIPVALRSAAASYATTAKPPEPQAPPPPQAPQNQAGVEEIPMVTMDDLLKKVRQRNNKYKK